MPDNTWTVGIDTAEFVRALADLPSKVTAATGQMNAALTEVKGIITALSAATRELGANLTEAGAKTSVNVRQNLLGQTSVSSTVKYKGSSFTQSLLDEPAQAREEKRQAQEQQRLAQSEIRAERTELAQLTREYNQYANAKMRADLATAKTPTESLLRVQAELQRPDLTATQSQNLLRQEALIQKQIAREAEQSSASVEASKVKASNAALAGLRQEEAEIRRLSAEYDQLAVSTLRRDLAGASPTERIARLNTELQRPDLTQAQTSNLTAQRNIAMQQANREQTREFDATARAADSAARSIARFTTAEFDAALKGQPLATQLQMIEARMSTMGAVDPARVKLSGQAAGIQSQISSQDARQAEQLADAQFRAAYAAENHAGKIRMLKDHLNTLDPTTVQYSRTLERLNNVQTGTSNRFDSMAMKIATSIIIWEGLRYVTQTITGVIDAQREYSLETARFAAITDQNVGSAIQQWNNLADVAAKAGVAPMQAASTIRIAAQMGPGNQAGQELFVQTATRLEELTGVASETISRSLSSALRQANLPLENVSHIGDLIANSLQRIPAAKLEDIINALQEAPALARLWGTSFEEAFNIIIEGSSRAQEGPEQVATAFQRLSQGLNEIAQGGEKAFTRQNQLLKDYGLAVNDANDQLRAIPEILKDVAQILPTLSAPRQQEFLNLISGGSVRPEQLRTIVGGIGAFTVDLGAAIEKLDGTLKKMTDIIDKSLGETIKVLDAKIEKLKESGGLLDNVMASILRGTVGQFGGKPGAYVVEQFVNAASAEQQGTTAKQGFLENFIKQAGGDPKEIARLVAEHNDQVRKVATEEIRKASTTIGSDPIAVANYAKGLFITEEDIKNYTQSTGVGRDMEAWRASARQATTSATTPQISKSAQQRALPQDPFSVYARGVMFGQEGGLTGESALPQPGGALDLSKLTQGELNQIKQTSLELDRQDTEAIREKVMLITNGDLVATKAVLDARREQIEQMAILVSYGDRMAVLTGAEAKYAQEAAQQLKQQKQERESSFQFRRLKDVEPAQFGQLQALSQMYNQFLTNIGSPEKSQNINLLLGENNVFKTMNVRMTALQLALEDLTKVEKAQLSGTWNLPAGATALVPISSLDIQRWNKSSGGGLSEEAIRALLGATEQSGTGVQGAVKSSADQISSTIREQFAKYGLAAPASEKVKDTGDIPAIIAAGREDLLNAVNAKLAQRDDIFAKINKMADDTRTVGLLPKEQRGTPTDPTQFPLAWQRQFSRGGEEQVTRNLAPFMQNLTNTIARNSLIGAPGMLGGGGGGYDTPEKGMSRQLQRQVVTPNVNVNVSMLPVKANFNANLMITMNGAVIARQLVPILYDMLIRTARSTGVTPKGAQRT